MPAQTHIVTLECAGNRRSMLDPPAEGEQWRLQRRIVDVALLLADDYNELHAGELRKLARELRAVEQDLVGIRALIRSLRARANDVRADAA